MKQSATTETCEQLRFTKLHAVVNVMIDDSDTAYVRVKECLQGDTVLTREETEILLNAAHALSFCDTYEEVIQASLMIDWIGHSSAICHYMKDETPENISGLVTKLVSVVEHMLTPVIEPKEDSIEWKRLITLKAVLHRMASYITAPGSHIKTHLQNDTTLTREETEILTKAGYRLSSVGTPAERQEAVKVIQWLADAPIAYYGVKNGTMEESGVVNEFILRVK